MGEDITNTIMNILNNKKNPKRCNNTFISFMPKTNNPYKPIDFRLIALCNVFMKIITKTISNKIKLIHPDIINENQSSFLHKRQITNNTMVAYEIFNHLNKDTRRKKGLVGIKLDIEKAYDKLDWNFIHHTLIRIGFPMNITNLIMKCVNTVSFFVLINGFPADNFQPTRGIRHEDPLSSYLFILCVNVFSNLVKIAQKLKNLRGTSIARRNSNITYLLFTDDNLIFYQAEEQEAKTLIKIIKKYQDNPGQKINLQKSQMMFSRSTINPKRDIFTNLLGILMTNKINTYLSLPTAIGKSKTRSFNFLLDRIRKKLYIWKSNTISYASRAAVIKAVAQEIPTYVMSFFLLPKSIGKKIDNLDARFW